MDSSMSAEVKELLKSAKEAIKNKDPKGALKICKSIIDKDKENYLAWVMTGAAAFEAGSKDQSIAAYQRALQISPKQAHAWQGLAQFYEKHNPTSSELSTVYNELRKIFISDVAKHNDYSVKYANILQGQSKFGQAANVYYTLLKEKFTSFEAGTKIDKASCVLVENLATLLSNPTVNDQPAEVYKYAADCVSLIEEETQQSLASRLDRSILTKLNENALKSMLKFQSDWRQIEVKCLNILADFDKENQTCFNALYDIYSEITMCAHEFPGLAKRIEAPQEDLVAKTSSVQVLNGKRSLIELLKLIYTEGANSTNQAKLSEIKTKLSSVKELASESADDMSGIRKIGLIYAENFYYKCVNDHPNALKTADEGISELEKSASLIIADLKPSILYKLHLNKAVSFFIAHDFKKSIQSFAKADAIAQASKIGDEEFYSSKAADLRKIEAGRYLIECHLRVDNKPEAAKTLENFNKLCSDSSLKKFADLGSLLMTIYSDNTPKSNATQVAHSLSEAYPNEFEFNFQFAKLAFSLLIARLKIKELQHSAAVGLTISESLLNDQTFTVEQLKTFFFNSSINSIRILPYRWEPVYLLGNYYKYLQNDSKRALKCFQKSYELCQDLNLVGLELVDCLLHEKEDAIATSLLKKAIAEIENCKWASLRLGIIHLKRGESNEAIRLFYNVIRNDPDDYNMWECLADAYLNRGSLTAALKSFAKAYELNSNSIYSCYQVAHIKQTLNLYDEAIIDYFSVLSKIPNHMPTLKGLGETYFQMAKLNCKSSNDDKYLNHMEMSLNYLAKAILMRRDLCCLWKILGDCCMIIRHAPSKQVIKMPVDKCLVEKNFQQGNPNNEQVMLNKAGLLKLAQESYKICCKLKSKCASYWHDLGLNYFVQFQVESEVLARSKSDKADLEQVTGPLDKSIECVTNAVNLEPQNEAFWSFLGVLYSRKSILHAKYHADEESVYNNQRYLAQHCFLKSLQLNDHDAILWTNLGVFYLLNNNFSLAHECFKKSQALDPEYGVAWIGQAHIAETVDFEQSIDLYRHSVELLMHTEAQYGYARIVSIITNDLELRKSPIYSDYIEFLNGHSMASDCLIKYCDRIDTNADAYFLGGILFERLNLPLTSLSFYQKALEILEADEKTSLSEDEAKICLLVRRGYARLLCELNRYEEALLQLKKVNVKDSIDDLFSLGRIFFKLGKYQQCSKIFESALNVADDSEISMVYTAIGMAQSKLNIQDSITWFFKSFQSKVVCIQSLFALCSIGLVKNDMKLINAVFTELDKHIEDKRHRFGIVKLKSIYFCLKKEYTKAIRTISKYLHEHPTESKCWIELCMCLKRANNFDLALTICNIVVFNLNSHDVSALCIRNSRSGDVSSAQVIYDCLQYLLLQKLIKNENTDRNSELLKIFEKTLHRYPANMSSWQLFKQFMSNYKNVDDEAPKTASG